MKLEKENIIKSPLNYYGNKSKLLTQILPLFPKDINNFYDVFCGGLDISLNVQANNVYANDKHEDLIWLWNKILKYNSETLGDELLLLDRKYFPMNEVEGKSLNTYGRTGDKETWNKLMNQKREVYYKLREEFNSSKDKDFRTIILLSLNSVGLQDSFKIENRKIKFTCGNNRVNRNNQNSLNSVADKIKHIKFTNNDFRYIKEIEFKENDFIYLDPPYLHTSQYEIKWNEQDEKDLYELLDYLHNNNIKFALSNFADGKNHNNEYLKEWCGKYNIHYLNDKHTNLNGISKKGKRQEILVTNYII